MSERVERWRPQAEAAASSTGGTVPVAFILAIIESESSGTPGATRGEPHLGDASIGLMQLLLATARGLGFTGDVGNAQDLNGLYDPQTNIVLGTKLAADLLRQLGNLENVASAYNGGIRPSLGFGKRYEGVNPVKVCLERDSNGTCVRWQTVHSGEFGNPQYVEKVMAAYARYGNVPGASVPPITPSSPASAPAPEPPADETPGVTGASGCAIVMLAGAAGAAIAIHSLVS